MEGLTKKTEVSRNFFFGNFNVTWAYNFSLSSDLFLHFLNELINETLPREIISQDELINVSGDEKDGNVLSVSGSYFELQETDEEEKEAEKKETKKEISFSILLNSKFVEFRGSSNIAYRFAYDQWDGLPDDIHIEALTSIEDINIDSFDLSLVFYHPIFTSASFGFAPRASQTVAVKGRKKTDLFEVEMTLMNSRAKSRDQDLLKDNKIFEELDMLVNKFICAKTIL